uniref:PCI domain-containing protein n=1 Tax=Kalanchoe fedtschenkoi TaxID=63787 RepID=A0A7N0ZQZ8_KALFE
MEGDDDASNPMTDEIIATASGDETGRSRPIISGGEQLDIEAYAGLYSGRTKVVRLMFIADRCGESNTTMQLEALRMAYDEIKKGENMQMFREVAEKVGGRLGPGYGMKWGWADAVDTRATQRKQKLENELTAYRTNLIEESIRTGYNDFGDFYYSRGHLADAFKNYVLARDYCTTSNHVIHTCLNAILVSIEMGQFSHVSSYVTKAEQTSEALDPVTSAKLRAADGLAHLESKKYKLAARKFLETDSELGNNYSEVIAAQDVATYGGLCALASFDRTELKNEVINNSSFRNFLELVPEVRVLINDFYSRISWKNLKSNLILDIHLHDHVETLYDQIRHKAIVEYTHPFVSVDLRIMANAFKTTTGGLEKELEALITDNQVQARIDSHNKILYAKHADQRSTTFQRVLQTGNEFDRDVRAMLLRASLMKHECSQRQPRTWASIASSLIQQRDSTL